ncbi:MAG TPA: RagB/SusD family nutrient uptake outer membrane protein [Fodinibius sp.]|nr:RagB/SusD family nutrient uptake outer membrane protein [Fodinibius sp.]
MKSPESNIDSEEAFENFENFQGFTEELYATIPNFTDHYWESNFNYADDMFSTNDIDYYLVDYFDNGNFWGWQSEHNGWDASWIDNSNGAPQYGGDGQAIELWDNSWYAIRKANLGLANLDKLQGTQIERNLIEGQLRFFRGWYYFQMMQLVGGLPYFSEPIAADATFDFERLSYQALADSIGQDFRAAADLLPTDWDDTEPGSNTSGNNELRINKIMALAYLGKNYLWAASPLMNNGSNENADSYSQEYAQQSADALGELLNLVQSGQTDYELLDFENWRENFRTIAQNYALPGGSERIFTAPYGGPKPGAGGAVWNSVRAYMPAIADNPKNFMPAANYVEYFGMANGLPLDAAGSGYSDSYPWRDRDPRFYKTFIYDGIQIVQGTIDDPALEEHRHANLYTGGSYRFAGGNSPGGSQTGYALLKFINVTFNRWDQGFFNNVHFRVPYLRLAEIYVMYGEAAAVASGSATGTSNTFDWTAAQAVNHVRNRANVPAIDSRYMGNVNDFLGEVRREWAVEFGFEKKRFTNLRRWLLLTDDRYAEKTAIFFERSANHDPDNPRTNEVLNLREEVIVDRNYSQRHYWLPLKRADVNISSSFKQNPGW